MAVLGVALCSCHSCPCPTLPCSTLSCPPPAFQEPSLPEITRTLIPHIRNCCSVHPPPTTMSSRGAAAEEERTEHLPWLCLEEEDKINKKRQKISSLFKLLLSSAFVTWVLVIALICTWGFLAGEGFFSELSFLCYIWLFPNSLLLAFIHPGWKLLAPGAQNGN